MKRILLTLAALVLTAACADAGPLRNWLASRRQCQPAPVVTYSPPPTQTYQPGPVQTVAANVLVGTGQIFQAAGQVVQAYQPAGFAPVARTCSGGGCR